jgi:hypothetical protein
MAKDLLAPDSLHSFLVASRTRSQSEILKMFLHTAIKQNAVAEAGSIHIYNPVTNKLYLFNDDQFLYKQGFLDRGPDWKETFDPWEGLAGAAFGKRQIQWTNNVDQEPKFTQTGGAVPIKTIACAPILFSEQRVPFGVASFHNDETQGRSTSTGSSSSSSTSRRWPSPSGHRGIECPSMVVRRCSSCTDATISLCRNCAWRSPIAGWSRWC